MKINFVFLPVNDIHKFERDILVDKLAEWSKALRLGRSLKGRGFESHTCQLFNCNDDTF
jgi:hypothetical protein